jgi:cytoskeletal protein CcmA (bactofilin family)
MTDEPPGRRLDPFDPQPPDWARVRADEVVRQIFAFEPGSGGWGPAGGWGRRRATTPPVLRFSDRYIVGVLDLRAVEFPHLLEFVRCRFAEPPDLRQAKIAGGEFDSCWLPGLEGRNLYSDNDLRLVGGTRVEGRVDLTDAEISGSLELTRARLVNVGGYALHADRLQLAGALLAANLEVRGQMRIPGLRTGGNINLAGALLDNPEGYALDGNGLHVGGNLQCVATSERPFRSIGRLYLPSARIDSDFSLRGAVLKPAREDYDDGGNQRSFDPRAALIADRMQVSGNVVLDQKLVSTGTLRIVNARIGGSLWLSGATIDLSDGQEPFEEQTGVKLPGPYPYRALHLDGTEVGGGIDARKTRIAGQVRLVEVNARGSVVLDGSVLSNRNGDVVEGRRFTTGGNLDARGVVVFGSMLLPEANIGANLDLRFSRLVNPGRYRRDQSQKPSVDLRVAHIGRDLVCARGEEQSFSSHGEIRIRRAEIGRQTNFQGAELGSRLSETAINAYGLITQELRVDVAAAPRGHVNLRHARCATLADNDKFWDATGHISLHDFRYDALAEPIEMDDDEQVKHRLKLLRNAMNDIYRPGPYDQFAAMLRANGNEEHASTVLIDKQRWRYAALADGYRVLGLPVRLWSVLQRWVVGYGYRPMRALLWLIALLVGGSVWFSMQSRPMEANADDHLVWSPVLFTIDQLVPIVDFGHKNRWHFEGASQWITAGLVAAGWILATTVAAGITRMLRRSST